MCLDSSDLYCHDYAFTLYRYPASPSNTLFGLKSIMLLTGVPNSHVRNFSPVLFITIPFRTCSIAMLGVITCLVDPSAFLFNFWTTFIAYIHRREDKASNNWATIQQKEDNSRVSLPCQRTCTNASTWSLPLLPARTAMRTFHLLPNKKLLR